MRFRILSATLDIPWHGIDLGTTMDRLWRMQLYMRIGSGLPVMLVLVGCSASTQPEEASASGSDQKSTDAVCSLAFDLYRISLENVNANGGDCVSAADCSLIEPRISCPGGEIMFEECAVAVSTDVAQRFSSQLARLQAVMCEEPCGYGGTSDCRQSTASCVGGRCRASAASP
jgi:hypothetical protein